MTLYKNFQKAVKEQGFFTALGQGAGAVISRFTIKHYGFFEKKGLHVIPVHYYEPIPDRKELQTRNSLWEDESELPGIDMNEANQL